MIGMATLLVVAIACSTTQQEGVEQPDAVASEQDDARAERETSQTAERPGDTEAKQDSDSPAPQRTETDAEQEAAQAVARPSETEARQNREPASAQRGNLDADMGSAVAGGSETKNGRPELEIITIIPKDGIPAILHPTFVDAGEGSIQMFDDELVIGLIVNGESHAYSVPFLSNREIVNDVVVGTPVAVTW